MKRTVALIITLVMVLSMIPVMTLSTAAATDGDWVIYRTPSTYKAEDGDIVIPAPGYQYTGEGLMTIAPDWTNYTPFFTVQTREAQSLKDGFYMEIRVDDYPYGGEDGSADHWISFNISDRPNVEPGNIEFGNNWLCLIRGAGSGSAQCQSFVTTATTDEAVGKFDHQGDINITAPIDDQGRESYVLEILPSGDGYEIKVNGSAVMGQGNISTKLNTWSSNGEFYVGVTVHAGIKDASASITVTKAGTSAADATTPVGDDSAEPEENMLVFGDLIDPATIPENTPALLWDATKSSFKADPTGVDMRLTAQGDDSYHLEVTGYSPYFQWSITPSLTVNQSDFPVFAMLMKDFWGSDGGVYYCAGEIMSARDDYKTSWSIYDDGCKFYGADDEYVLVVIDMAELGLIDESNSGRIHNIRPFFAVTDVEDLDICQWDVNFMGYFRSVEEAQNYTVTRLNLSEETEEATETPAEETTATPVEETTATPVEETTATPDGETTAAPADETEAPAKKGCKSVIGFGAVAILTAAAAAVALKKKD